jgi:hypothetical protein
MAVDERLLEKIRKMLNKADPAKNPSAEEAQSAMLLAQEFMARHGITMEDVQTEDEPVKKEVVDTNIDDYHVLPWWENDLANLIAKNFRCINYRNYRSTYRGGSSRRIYRHCFVGLKEDVEIAREVFLFAVAAAKSQLSAFCKDWLNSSLGWGYASVPASVKNDYMLGFIQGLRDKFQEQVNKNNWGLILVKDQAVTEYYEDKSKGFKKGRTSQISSGSRDFDHAYTAGYKDGKRFEAGPSGAKKLSEGR